MKNKYAKINSDGELEIHTDNGMLCDGEYFSEIFGTFEIDSVDLLKIYSLLVDKRITKLTNVKENKSSRDITHYMVVGENVENIHLMNEYVELKQKIEQFNRTRHWWERKIDI